MHHFYIGQKSSEPASSLPAATFLQLSLSYGCVPPGPEHLSKSKQQVLHIDGCRSPGLCLACQITWTTLGKSTGASKQQHKTEEVPWLHPPPALPCNIHEQAEALAGNAHAEVGRAEASADRGWGVDRSSLQPQQLSKGLPDSHAGQRGHPRLAGATPGPQTMAAGPPTLTHRPQRRGAQVESHPREVNGATQAFRP